jgi:hypothetical protein
MEGRKRLLPRDQADLQPPLPLQLFFPLQPMSPVWQPPCPLQLFSPLQSCLLEAESDALDTAPELEQPVTVIMVPATNPAIAAETINVLAVLVIVIILLRFLMFLIFDRGTQPSRRARSEVFVVC